MTEEKKQKKRTDMREQEPRERARNFKEVPFGYTLDEALLEASRCLNCKKHPCVSGCPVNINIPDFIQHIKTGDFLKAIKIIKSSNSLPAICGRVCPQETQCVLKCVLGKKGQPIAIGRLERFASDYEAAQGEIQAFRPGRSTGKRVAIVGSGPAGLSAAAELAKMGHQVTLFEALHKTGGVLIYCIPEFRLPNVRRRKRQTRWWASPCRTRRHGYTVLHPPFRGWQKSERQNCRLDRIRLVR